MKLSETGIVRLQELYWELGSLLESHMVEFDKIIMVHEGKSPEQLEMMIELLKNTVMEFEEETNRIYTDEYNDENQY
jgi:hypothetical protein